MFARDSIRKDSKNGVPAALSAVDRSRIHSKNIALFLWQSQLRTTPRMTFIGKGLRHPPLSTAAETEHARRRDQHKLHQIHRKASL